MAFESSKKLLKIPDERMNAQWNNSGVQASHAEIALNQIPDALICISDDFRTSTPGEGQEVVENLNRRKLRARGPGSIRDERKIAKLAVKRLWPDCEDDEPNAKKALEFEQLVPIYDRNITPLPQIENSQNRKQNNEFDFAFEMSAQPSAKPEDMLVGLFQDCKLEKDERDEAQIGCDQAAMPASQSELALVHLKLPCKTPQSQSQVEIHQNDSVATANSDSGSIILASDDSSATPCSFLHSSELCNSSDFEELRKEFTEDSSHIDLSLDSASSSNPSATETDMKTPKLGAKRRSPETKDHVLAKKISYQNRDEMNTSNQPVVTRSGRVVVSRPNQQFDYSSSSKDDGEEDSDEVSLDADDDEYEEEDFDQLQWTDRKRRSFRNSSLAINPEGSLSSPESVPPMVYVELGGKVVIIRDKPQPNIVLEDDEELKTQMHKFLGLMPSRRKLFDPAEYNMDRGDNEMDVYVPISIVTNPSLKSSPSPGTPSAKPPMWPETTPTSTCSKLNLSYSTYTPSENDLQAKSTDDFITQVNLDCFQEKTPGFIKEPIDLSELPSQKQLATNCRRHRSCLNRLERHPHFYGFVQSIRLKVPINMCHPLAISFRRTSFQKYKVALAKILFNMFNHAIFHCGLQVPIVWKHAMKKRSKGELGIDAFGRRRAEILLLHSINRTAELINLMLHEMCHAAAFLFNRELGHGDNCRRWAYQAKMAFPEVPAITECIPSFMYTCSMCSRSSYASADFQAYNIRCYYCQFEVSVKTVNKANLYEGTRSDRTMTPFKCFIRDKYLKLGEEGGATHSSKMALLNEQFAKMKAATD
ncbi:uncharacterized protein LOC6616186 isoform X1 [Drosophila sechellia]|uniref:uncharacterized protein LOC6616186 isoform X1 n=1 Tax=Drosophila sechellia TaxID=7238 RepID=UPI0013DD9404|nr:uncharacterized protein LOC6616186 isoform X1 [Drosophila sechellia]